MTDMAETYEMAGDLKQAHRWVAMGMSRLQLTPESDEPYDYEVEMLLDARSRVREALGFPPDELDG
ncbi:hypothetical protein [Blastococcus sp. SYSU DS0539]